MAYIKGEKKPIEGCVFCNIAASDDDLNNLVVVRGTHHYIVLNRYPYNNGHLMIVPYEHVASLEALSDDALAELMRLANQALAVLRHTYKPAAFNLGANLGPAAGAGIAEHFHFHVVPRWGGDANFMSVVGETRVIPDMLNNTCQDLRQTWQLLFKQGH
jgi:ATP adenylyltransferase